MFLCFLKKIQKLEVVPEKFRIRCEGKSNVVMVIQIFRISTTVHLIDCKKMRGSLLGEPFSGFCFVLFLCSFMHFRVCPFVQEYSSQSGSRVSNQSAFECRIRGRKASEIKRKISLDFFGA